MTRRNARRAFGSVRKLPSGRYQARYRDLAGSEHAGPATFATRADANRFLATVEADLLRGAWSNPRLGKTTFREWVEQWRKTTTSLRPKTTDLYEYLLRRFLLPAFGELPLAHLDVIAVQTWLAEEHNADQVRPSTIAKAYRLLRRILGCAVQAGYLPLNPCVVRGAGTEYTPEMRIATVEQVAKLADAVPPRYRALVLVAAYGGLRWGELVGLRVRRGQPAARQRASGPSRAPWSRGSSMSGHRRRQRACGRSRCRASLPPSWPRTLTLCHQRP